jgi:HSP20 family protein
MSLVLRNWEPYNLFKEFDNVLSNRVQDGIWSPKVNIVENEKGYTISAELPGVSKDDIDIDLKDNTLSIKGEKKAVTKDEKENYIRVESIYGKFERSFSVSDDIDRNGVNASFNDGVLTLVLNKKEESKPKQIKVEVK